MQLPGQQFCLANILRKKAKHQLATFQMLRLKPKGTITSYGLTFCVTQPHYISQLLCPASHVQHLTQVPKGLPWQRTIHNSCTDTCSATKTAMVLHYNSAHVQRRACTTPLPPELLQGEPEAAFDSHVLQVNI